MSRIIAIALLFALIGASEGKKRRKTMYETLKDEEFYCLIGMIDTLEKDYGLQSLLDDSTFKGTVFALTDTACREMEAQVGSLLEMADIIKYHVIPSERLNTKSVPKGLETWETALTGHTLQTSREKKTINVLDEQDQTAKISEKGTRVGKAIIYKTYKALEPDV